MNSSEINALAIVGPTASGKSALGLWMAEQGWPIEIISLDSALVFKDMNIGTAKPNAQELASVPHHLIDLITPEQSFSAADFVRHCERLITEIRKRGKVPVILGGTMMYYKALVAGIDQLPPADTAIRTEIDAMAQAHGWPSVHAELAKVDPVSAQRLFPNDSQRLQRALEVYRITGQPLSSFHARESQAPRQLTTLAIEPSVRSVLHERIASRFHSMLEAGFVKEVSDLLEQYALHESLPSIRCVGYRQVYEYLKGQVQYSEMIEKGIAATRQLAKRQITWLRSTDPKTVVDPLQSQWVEGIAPWLEAQINAQLAKIPTEL